MSLGIIVEKRQEGVYIIKITGNLDTETHQELEEKLKPLLIATTSSIVFDMSGLTYISSAGLGVLFRAQKALEDNKGNLLMLNLRPQIKKVFEIIKALPKESVFETMEEVDAYLDAIQKREVEKQNPPAA